MTRAVTSTLSANNILSSDVALFAGKYPQPIGLGICAQIVTHRCIDNMGLLSFLNPWRKVRPLRFREPAPAYRFYRPLQTPPPDYETILSRLSTEISEAKTNLSEIKLRERRYMLLLNAYSLLLWLIWTGLWWLNGLPWGLVGLRTEDPLTKAIGSGLTLLSPLG
jgi:hypothetical protein